MCGINMDAKLQAIKDYGVIFELHVLLVDYIEKESVVLPYTTIQLFLWNCYSFSQQPSNEKKRRIPNIPIIVSV